LNFDANLKASGRVVGYTSCWVHEGISAYWSKDWSKPEKFKANLEAGDILKEQFAASWRECDKANKEYMKDRRAATALRTLTSKEVDDELATKKTFRDQVADDQSRSNPEIWWHHFKRSRAVVHGIS
jgi:hypothetical protein